MPKRGSGGRRPGAGAPKGNKNGLRTGRRVGDPLLRRALLRVPAEEREHLIQAIKQGAKIVRRAPANVITLPSAATAASAQSKRTGESGGLMNLVHRLTGHGFFGALPFVRKHFPVVGSLDPVLDHLERLAIEEPEEFAAIRNKGGFIRSMFHEATAEVHDVIFYCRFCNWQQSRLVSHEMEADHG